MGNESEDMEPVRDEILALYLGQFCTSTELEVMRVHAARGGKTLYTIAEISEELEDRMVKGLVSKISKQVEELIRALNQDCRRLEGTLTNDAESVDDATFRHELFSAHAEKARRDLNKLKRIVAHVHHFAQPAETDEAKELSSTNNLRGRARLLRKIGLGHGVRLRHLEVTLYSRRNEPANGSTSMDSETSR